MSGERLPSERELAATLKVCRGSIREALVVLELCGEVEVRNSCGVFVAEKANMGPSLSEIMAARRMIEPELAAMAARVATDEAIDRILTVVDRMERTSIGRPNNEQDERDFLKGIALACGNSVILGVLTLLWTRGSTLNDHLSAGSVDPAMLADRRAVAHAIATRNPSAARRAMLALLDRSSPPLRPG